MAAPRPPCTLKARALRWLAQRDHSRLELERKLMRAARTAHVAADRATMSGAHEQAAGEMRDGLPLDAETARRDIEVLLDWLQANGYPRGEMAVREEMFAVRCPGFRARRGEGGGVRFVT